MSVVEDNRAAALEHLARGIRRCRRCPLHAQRRHAVPGEGPIAAPLMFVGEAPGVAEDRSGQPFVGPAGRFLDGLLQEQGIRREQVFITSCVKCRPPANRSPRRAEVQTCLANWLMPQLELIGPRIVVLLGQVAMRALLGETAPLSELHGTLQQRQGRACFMTYHPAAGMRFPALAERMRADFAALSRLLGE
jgi:DNA polymerase